MKVEPYTKKDGTEGKTYIPEAGDRFVARFDKPLKSEYGMYENWILGVTTAEHGDISIRLTKGQNKGLSKYVPLTGKQLGAYNYTHTKYKDKGELTGIAPVETIDTLEKTKA